MLSQASYVLGQAVRSYELVVPYGVVQELSLPPTTNSDHCSIGARRRSKRSVLRYAAFTRLEFTCAKASSQTSRGTSVHSAAQSRKDDRKPCGTASISSSRTSLETVPPWIARARCDGKTKPRAVCQPARLAENLQRADSGTRCSRPAFIRLAGIVHVADAKSISSRVASRTSPDRLAVSSERLYNLDIAGFTLLTNATAPIFYA